MAHRAGAVPTKDLCKALSISTIVYLLLSLNTINCHLLYLFIVVIALNQKSDVKYAVSHCLGKIDVFQVADKKSP